MQRQACRSGKGLDCSRGIWSVIAALCLCVPAGAWAQSTIARRTFQAPPPAAPVVTQRLPALARAQPRTQQALPLYSIGDPTDEEQQWLEYVNFERANPQAEAQVLENTTDPEVVGAYNAFGVELSAMVTAFAAINPAPPLSMNSELMAAARGHSQDMLTHTYQGHTGSDGSTIAQRIAAQGYTAGTIGENVFASASSVFDGNAAFEVDWGVNPPTGMQDPPGHRNNDHYPGFAEIGIGVVDGTASASGTLYGPLVCTMDFGTQATYTPFVTGVVYYDLNGNGVYDMGEGLGGVTVNLSGATFSASTANSGGYSIPTSGSGSQTVTFSVSGAADQQVATTLTGTSNAKVDLKLTYTPPVVSGAANPPVNQDSTYQFSALPGASSYQFKQSQLVPFATAETGASGTSDFTVTTTGSYNVIAGDEPFNGVASFHLAHQTEDEQVLALNFNLLPSATSALQFESLLGYATSTEIARAQVSTDSGNTWQDVWTLAGTNGPGNTSFNAQSISFSQFAGQEIMVRFVYDATVSYYNTLATGVGLYLDNIQVTNANKLTNTVVTAVTTGTSFIFHPTITGQFALAVRAQAVTRFFPWGPDDIVAVPGGGGSAPAPTTDAATSVSTTSATLNGSVIPNGADTRVTFEYGLTSSYGTTTPSQDIGSGTSAVAVEAPISSLLSGSTYHFRVTGSNANGVTNGADLSFATNATVSAPGATTDVPSDIGETSATLNGSVNPNGADTMVTFDYGPTSSYGATTLAQDIGGGTAAVPVNAPIASLLSGSTYHFRVTGSNAEGVTNGGDLSFSTSAGVGNAPTITTTPTTGVTAVSATLNGTVNPNGFDTIILFEYGLDTTYKTHTLTADAGSGTALLTAFANISGFKPNMTYHFRLSGSNANGVTNGGDQSFTTGTGISFTPFAGKYVGVIATNPASNATSGIISMAVSANGSFSAGGKLGGKNLAFRGQFDAGGDFSVTLKNNLQVQLRLVMQQVGVVVGTVTVGSLSTGITLNPEAKTASPLAFTIRLPALSGSGLPQGNGYGTIKMPAKSSAATFAGKLGDGTSINFGGAVVTDGSNAALSMIPVYISLYGGKGSISGILTRETTVNGDLDGMLNWFKLNTSGAFFPAPFATQATLFGSLYAKPQPGQPVINLMNGTVTFNAGDLANPPLQNTVVLGTNNKITVTVAGTDKLKMSINVSNGLFSGSFVGPDAPKATPFSGALFQGGLNFGLGVFKGPADPGSVDFQ